MPDFSGTDWFFLASAASFALAAVSSKAKFIARIPWIALGLLSFVLWFVWVVEGGLK